MDIYKNKKIINYMLATPIVCGLIIYVCSSFSKQMLPDTGHDKIKVSITEDTVRAKLESIRYKHYINKEVSKLLDDIAIANKKILFVTMRPKVLAFISIKYNDSLWLDIYIEKYKFLKQFLDENETEDVWKESDLRKEKVGKIRLRVKSDILKEYPKKPKLPNV